MSRKILNDFDDAIRFLEKIENSDMKLEEDKNEQNVFKLNLNDMEKEVSNQKSKKVQ